MAGIHFLPWLLVRACTWLFASVLVQYPGVWGNQLLREGHGGAQVGSVSSSSALAKLIPRGFLLLGELTTSLGCLPWNRAQNYVLRFQKVALKSQHRTHPPFQLSDIQAIIFFPYSFPSPFCPLP